MSTHVICPDCGARNALGALWCGQCYHPLGETTEPPAVAGPVDTGTVNDPQMQLDLPLPDKPRVGRGSWTCGVCGRVNPLAESTCSTCGSTIFDAFKEAPPEPRDPGKALIRGLVAPGLGHVFARQPLLGMSVGALTLIGIALGIVLMVHRVMLAGLALALMGGGVWVAGALDAYRWARNEPDEVLLRPRVLTVIMAVMFIVLVAAAVSARRGQ
ncbi:MAG: zinc ribbon domain-containing protein [Acidimicrobiia bacterium]